MSTSAQHINSRVLHSQLASQVPIDPLNLSIFICIGSFCYQVIYILTPVLYCSISNFSTLLCNQFYNCRMQRFGSINWCSTAFNIMNFSTFIRNDQSSFKLTDVFSIDSKICLQWKINLYIWWNINEGAT